jgi:hypothetical protein
MPDDDGAPFMPTPEQIAEACAEIRRGWKKDRFTKPSRHGDESIGAVQEIEMPKNSMGQPMV